MVLEMETMMDKGMKANPIDPLLLDQTNRGGKNGFQNRNGSRSGFQDRMNCMNEEDCDDDYDNDMDDEELFMCCISEFQENTGLEVVPYEESN